MSSCRAVWLSCCPVVLSSCIKKDIYPTLFFFHAAPASATSVHLSLDPSQLLFVHSFTTLTIRDVTSRQCYAPGIINEGKSFSRPSILHILFTYTYNNIKNNKRKVSTYVRTFYISYTYIHIYYYIYYYIN